MTTRIAVLILLLGCSLSQAEKLSDDDILGVWEARFASTHQDSMLGKIKWIQIDFLQNNQVEWTWEREGKIESHKGKYSISVTPSKNGARQTLDVSINPTTMAVYRSITLNKAHIGHDNRFELPAKVLKCNDFEGNPLVFSRAEKKDK
jgi:hypothetical protein